jgi:osmotically-inducible protein OsmY
MTHTLSILSRRLALFSLIAGLGALGACSSTRTQEGTGQYVDDTVITTKVKALILNEPMLKSAEINVETFKARVQLSGFVSSRPAMDKAVELTRSVVGVASVANDMRLK